VNYVTDTIGEIYNYLRAAVKTKRCGGEFHITFLGRRLCVGDLALQIIYKILLANCLYFSKFSDYYDTGLSALRVKVVVDIESEFISTSTSSNVNESESSTRTWNLEC